MRITGVEIANYRGFAGDSFRLTLEHGENLLVYGENGAGKSSLYNTLKDFLHAATNKNVNIEQQRNRDNPAGAPAIRISTTVSPEAAWIPGVRGQDTNDWRTLDDGKGFLDYRVLLRFYNAPQDSTGRIDLFRLLVEGMLSQHRMEVPGNPTFLSEWRWIEKEPTYRLYESDKQALKTRVDRFNAAFQLAAVALATRATELLRDFDPNLGITFACDQNADFTWNPKRLTIPRFVAEAIRPDHAPISDCHNVFNEARLSAMAICLFFAALETCPIHGPRLLVLDDVLIGLDMTNRSKVINLVQRLFPDWQIIILTYHKAWFEVLKSRIRLGAWAGHSWRSVILRPERHQQNAFVTIVPGDSGTALETAAHCLGRRDHRAAAVYARTAFEVILHKHADRLHLPVQFKSDHLKLDTDDFLNPLEKRFERLIDPQQKALSQGLVAELRFIRRTILNAYAHADEISEDEIVGEVEHGIDVVHRFETFLESLEFDDFDEVINTDALSIGGLLTVASEMSAAGNFEPALLTAEAAAQALVCQRCELKQVQLPYRRHYPHSMLYGLAFPKADLSQRGVAVLKMVGPYLLGNITRDHFDPARFEATLRFIAQINFLDTLPLFAPRPEPALAS